IIVIEAAYLFSVSPWTYFVNMRTVNANHNPNHLFYLFGNFSRRGWWYYFPAAFVVKETVPLLITVALASIHFFFKPLDAWGEMIILVSIVSYLGILTVGADDIGFRYVLPVLPLLLVWCSRIAVELTKKRAGLALAALLVLLQARAAVWAFPNYIPYV